MRSKKLREQREEKMLLTQAATKSLKTDHKEKIDYLVEKDQARSKIVSEIKDALWEDIEQKKEIYLLKKKD